MRMVMTSDETEIQIFTDWPSLHARRVTKADRESPELSSRCRDKETADRQTYPAEKSWSNHIKMSRISDVKRAMVPKILNRLDSIISFYRKLSTLQYQSCIIVF